MACFVEIEQFIDGSLHFYWKTNHWHMPESELPKNAMLFSKLKSRKWTKVKSSFTLMDIFKSRHLYKKRFHWIVITKLVTRNLRWSTLFCLYKSTALSLRFAREGFWFLIYHTFLLYLLLKYINWQYCGCHDSSSA